MDDEIMISNTVTFDEIVHAIECAKIMCTVDNLHCSSETTENKNDSDYSEYNNVSSIGAFNY